MCFSYIISHIFLLGTHPLLFSVSFVLVNLSFTEQTKSQLDISLAYTFVECKEDTFVFNGRWRFERKKIKKGVAQFEPPTPQPPGVMYIGNTWPQQKK